MRPWIIAGMCASVAACSAPAAIELGTPDHGDWVPFYSRDAHGQRMDYSYDRTELRDVGNRLTTRWRVQSRREGQSYTTMTVIEIDCRRGVFTEKATALIDPAGSRRELPAAELASDVPIAHGTSSDVFRQRFCR